MSLVRQSILSVDHHEDTCLMLALILTQEGYSVTTATSSEEALSIARREEFNLYVLDFMMPGVDGIQLCQMIRQFDPHTPIIIYSGAALDLNIEEALRAGANAFVAKPHIHDLVETSKMLLLL